MLDDIHQRYTWDFPYPPPQVSITLLVSSLSYVKERTYSGDDITFMHRYSINEAVICIWSSICLLAWVDVTLRGRSSLRSQC